MCISFLSYPSRVRLCIINDRDPRNDPARSQPHSIRCPRLDPSSIDTSRFVVETSDVVRIRRANGRTSDCTRVEMSAPWPVHRGVMRRKVFDRARRVSYSPFSTILRRERHRQRGFISSSLRKEARRFSFNASRVRWIVRSELSMVSRREKRISFFLFSR